MFSALQTKLVWGRTALVFYLSGAVARRVLFLPDGIAADGSEGGAGDPTW